MTEIWQAIVIGFIFSILFTHFMDLRLVLAATGS